MSCVFHSGQPQYKLVYNRKNQVLEATASCDFCFMQATEKASSIKSRVDDSNWEHHTNHLHEKGYTILPGLLTHKECDSLKASYANPDLYRKTIVMERYRFGLGEYKYFKYPLPNLLQALRENIYTHLAPIANTWMRVLNIDLVFPASHPTLLEHCQAQQQVKPTLLILKYGEGGFNTLHQDLYGEVYFPLQCVLFLNEPGNEYTGGEFIMTQQTPRAQSKAIVLQPRKGDVLIFTTHFRPVKGSKGYYRAVMKHGVSEVHQGERYTLGIIFHDALS